MSALGKVSMHAKAYESTGANRFLKFRAREIGEHCLDRHGIVVPDIKLASAYSPCKLCFGVLSCSEFLASFRPFP